MSKERKRERAPMVCRMQLWHLRACESSHKSQEVQLPRVKCRRKHTLQSLLVTKLTYHMFCFQTCTCSLSEYTLHNTQYINYFSSFDGLITISRREAANLRTTNTNTIRYRTRRQKIRTRNQIIIKYIWANYSNLP